MPMDDRLVLPDEHSTAMLSWYDQPPLQRKSSLPNCTVSSFQTPPPVDRPRGKSAPGLPPAPENELPGDATAARRRGFSLARPQSAPIKISIGKTRRRRKVTFKNMYAPDEVPAPTVESYDELVFNVAGLFHTQSFLHDPEDWGDDPTASMSSEEYYDPEPPLERSVPLMIAEFLYRSAVYLGYRAGETPWLPGFREDKRFSGNDVKRWRRLAHFDWETEEEEYKQTHCAVPTRPKFESVDSATSLNVDASWHNSVLANVGANVRLRHQDSNTSVDSIASNATSRSQDSTRSGRGKAKLRTAVSGWIHKHRRSRRGDRNNETELQQQTQPEPEEDIEKSAYKKRQDKQKVKPVSWLDPPPISSSKDLDLLVDIINSCVYCGQFQFRKRDIVALCNVKI